MFCKKRIKRISIVLMILTIITCSAVFATGDSIYVWSNESEPLKQTNAKVDSEETNTSEQKENALNLTCGGAVLIEQHSGEVLYDYHMHEKLRPASVTKVMSILLIMEALDSGQILLTDKVPCTEEAARNGRLSDLAGCKGRTDRR